MDLTPFKNCFAHKNAVYISTNKEPLAPCCFFKKGYASNTWIDYQSQVRKVDIAEGCKYCIDMEKGGATWSHRTQYDQDFYRDPNFGKIFVAGVCFDNVCNLKCTTCGPANSSQWIGDYTKLNLWANPEHKKQYTRMGEEAPQKIEFLKNTLATAEYDTFRLDIFGGEPAINPLILDFIDWLANSEYASKVMINVTTNGTRFFQKLIDYYHKFKYLSIQISIDGIEDHFEYLRYGASWSEVKNNILRYDVLAGELVNFSLSLHYTLSWMNSMHFADFYKWVFKNTLNMDGLNLTKVMGPKRYSVDILSPKSKEHIKTQVLDKINKIDLSMLPKDKQDNYKHLISLYCTSIDSYSEPVYTEDYTIIEAQKMLTQLDSIRNTDYKKTFVDVIGQLDRKDYGR